MSTKLWFEYHKERGHLESLDIEENDYSRCGLWEVNAIEHDWNLVYVLLGYGILVWYVITDVPKEPSAPSSGRLVM